MSPPKPSELNDHNKSAWNELYASTPELVWGHEPVGFLPGCLPGEGQLPAGPVLDAAAGEGRNLSLLLELGREVTACDASAAALAKIPPENRRKVATVVCDLAAVPLPEGRFALILLSDAIETLPDPRPVLAELFRLLLPGGCLLANVPEHDDGVAKVEMEPAPGGGSLYQGRYYYHFYTRAEAEALFTAAGFGIVASHDCRWAEPPHPNFRDRAHRHHSRVILARRPA